MALTFSDNIRIPFFLILNLRYSTSFLYYSHFFKLIYKFFSVSAVSIFFTYFIYFFFVFEKIKILLKYIITEMSSIFFNILLINIWQLAGALINLKNII